MCVVSVMANETTPATTPIPTWILVAAIAGSSGAGSFLGSGGVDDQPSERLAKIESELVALRASVRELGDLVRGVSDKQSRIETRVWRNGYRLEQIEGKPDVGGSRRGDE